eukprot:symbB.v1.2.026784.t1/scaffold2667.1/size73508/2
MISKIQNLDGKIKNTKDAYDKAKGAEKDKKLEELKKLREEKLGAEKQRKAAEAELEKDKKEFNVAKKASLSGSNGWRFFF